MRLRAHHICCSRFVQEEHKDRGAGFQGVRTKIMDALLSQPDAPITVAEGVDELCYQCPEYADGRCSHPKGDEVEVRKWDAILLRELGLTFDTCLTSREWSELLEQKTPFHLCLRCKSRESCSVGVKAV